MSGGAIHPFRKYRRQARFGNQGEEDDEICQLWQVQSECRGNSILVELRSKKTHTFLDAHMLSIVLIGT